MATFAVDLLKGGIYLFNGNFTGSGSTPTSGSTYPEVNLYSNLPTPASSYNGKIYIVRNGSGDYVLNRKDAGLYFSTGILWRRLGDIPAFFDSNNFQIYDGSDNSKGFEFITSGISTGVFRQIKVQNADGTIAYLTDIGAKLDTSIFAGYTGTTAPNTYLSISDFDTYTGVTAINEIFLTHTGGTELNTVVPTVIDWDIVLESGSSFNFSGGSDVFILEDGDYEVSYNIPFVSNSNKNISIGANLILNDTTIINVTAAADWVAVMGAASNVTIPTVILTLNTNNKLTLAVFRTGADGSVTSKLTGSLLIKKKNTLQ